MLKMWNGERWWWWNFFFLAKASEKKEEENLQNGVKCTAGKRKVLCGKSARKNVGKAACARLLARTRAGRSTRCMMNYVYDAICCGWTEYSSRVASSSPIRSFYALSVPDLVVVGATRLQDIVWQHHLQAVSGNQPAATRSENDA